MSAENKINHQFLNSKFFFPNWKIQTLVLGTFNPSCGEETGFTPKEYLLQKRFLL